MCKLGNEKAGAIPRFIQKTGIKHTREIRKISTLPCQLESQEEGEGIFFGVKVRCHLVIPCSARSTDEGTLLLSNFLIGVVDYSKKSVWKCVYIKIKISVLKDEIPIS